MPYRRLPNTDASRLKALNSAYDKGREIPPFKLAFSQSSFNQLQSFLFSFEKAIKEHRGTYNKQIEKNKDYQQTLKKAKIYISHFIQVMNMAISRGELPYSTRKFYNLKENEKKVPLLNTESDVIDLGQNIIDGEMKRIQQGLTPVTNPTIAVVKVRYEKFLDAYQFQKTLQKNHMRSLNELAKLRHTADTIITDIWNEVEEHFKELPEKLRREKSSEYGVVYVYRKNEINKFDFVNTEKLSIM